MSVSVDDIENVLPQTQCQECGYPGCRPYAEALATQHAPIDRCPPGGVDTLKKLARLLQQDPAAYIDDMAQHTRAPQTAIIRGDECIGCTKCIQACPVDAIIGAAKQLHVILKQECTGCGLCIEPCPVDCIDLKPLKAPAYNTTKAKLRYYARAARLQQNKQQAQTQHQHAKRQQTDHAAQRQTRQAYIAAAIARVNAKKAQK